EALPAFADHGVVAVREADHEIMGVGGPGGGDDLGFGGVGIAIANVVGDRAMKQVRLLQDHSNLPPQPFHVIIPQIPAVEEYLAVGRVVKPADQVDEGALAGAAGPAKAD